MTIDFTSAANNIVDYWRVDKRRRELFKQIKEVHSAENLEEAVNLFMRHFNLLMYGDTITNQKCLYKFNDLFAEIKLVNLSKFNQFFNLLSEEQKEFIRHKSKALMKKRHYYEAAMTIMIFCNEQSEKICITSVRNIKLCSIRLENKGLNIKAAELLIRIYDYDKAAEADKINKISELFIKHKKMHPETASKDIKVLIEKYYNISPDLLNVFRQVAPVTLTRIILNKSHHFG